MRISFGCQLLARSMSALLVLGLLHSCSGEEVILKTADGVELSAEDIDRQPLALMPGGAVGMFNVDVGQLLKTPSGSRVLAMTQSHIPLPASAQFVPERDLQRVLFGLYSFQGVDFVGVASGKFDRKAIEAAADASETTPLGTPLVRVQYAGRVFYVSANLGFVVLTDNTALFGNETGIRRALDRLERGHVAVEVAPEIAALMQQPNAPVAFASDAHQDPGVRSVAGQLQFLNGMSMLRLVGNFDPPGLNLAGTLTYPDADSAQTGKQSMEQLQQNITTLGFITAAFGLAQPIQRLEANVVETSLQVSVAVDAAAASNLLDALARLIGGTPQ